MIFKTVYDPNSDYCSSSPDRLFGVNHNYACFLHDRQYRNEVQNRKTRKQADIQLRNGIFRAYANKNKRIIGWVISRIYYIGVRLFAGFAWS